MEAMNVSYIDTQYGKKEIAVFSCDIRDFDREIDILTTSAFSYSYEPTPTTMFAALNSIGIDARKLAENPLIDLRKTNNIWLSEEIDIPKLNVHRLGCVELVKRDGVHREESDILNAIKAYFKLLDIAGLSGIKMETVAMPLLGGGCQNVSADLTLIPIVHECIELLKRNEAVKKIYFIEYSPQKAFKMAMTLEKLYSIQRESMKKTESERKHITSDGNLLFISYTTVDKSIADNLCAKLESKGMKVWYAPRDVDCNDYATSIVNAISSCTHFVTIISRDSMSSEHVLNEIDLAFKELKRSIHFHPVRIDDEELKPAFSYYLSRQHWIEASAPPLEKRIEEIADKIISGTV